MNLQIAIIISAFGLCVTMPIFVRYFAYTNWPLWGKLAGFILCILVAILPMFSSRNWADTYGKYFALVEYTLYFIYIFAVILFAITCMRDVIWLILHWLKMLPSPFDVGVFCRVNLVTVLFVLLCSIWSLYEGTKIPAERYTTILSPKINQEKTVVVLSDLHISRTTNPDKIKAIVKKANALQPDLIVLTGDTVDDDLHVIRPIVQQLGDLEAKQGVYFVSGNHEFYIGYQNAMQELEQAGLKSAENTKIALAPDFYIAGVSDIPTTIRFGGVSRVAEILKSIPDSAYTLLLSHSPMQMDLPFDLQISGHTHGGQIFPFHVFSWLGNHHLLAGYYPQKRIYISRGSGQWGPQMRFLAPSEISILHLKKK